MRTGRNLILVFGALLSTLPMLVSASTCEGFGPALIPLQPFGSALANYSFGPCSPFLPAAGSVLLYFPPIATSSLVQISFMDNSSTTASSPDIFLAVQSPSVNGVRVDLSLARQGIAIVSVEPGSYGAVELVTVSSSLSSSPPPPSGFPPSSSSPPSTTMPASFPSTSSSSPSMSTYGVSGPCFPDSAYTWTLTNVATTEVAVSVGVKWTYRLPTGVSQRSCRELAANSRVAWSWASDGLDPIMPVAPSLTPTVDQTTCVSGLDDQNKCRPSTAFDRAFEWCQLLGSRLCGADEILARVGNSVQCVDNGLSFWTTTFCAETRVVVVDNPSRTQSCQEVTMGAHHHLCCGDQADQPWLGPPLSSAPSSLTSRAFSRPTSSVAPSPAPSVFNVYASDSPTASPTATLSNSTIRSEIRFLRDFSTMPNDFERNVQWGLANALRISPARISDPSERAGSVYYAFDLMPGSGDRTGAVVQSLRNLVMDPDSALHTNSNMSTLDPTYFRTGLPLRNQPGDNTTVYSNISTPSPAAALLYVPNANYGWGKKQIIIIAVLAALALVLVVLIIVWCCCCRSSGKRKVQAEEGNPNKPAKIMVDAAADNDPPNPRLHLPPADFVNPLTSATGETVDGGALGSGSNTRSRKKPQLSPRSGRPLRPQRPRNNKPGRSTSRSRDAARPSYHDEADVSDVESRSPPRAPPRPVVLPANSLPQPQQPIIR